MFTVWVVLLQAVLGAVLGMQWEPNQQDGHKHSAAADEVAEREKKRQYIEAFNAGHAAAAAGAAGSEWTHRNVINTMGGGSSSSCGAASGVLQQQRQPIHPAAQGQAGGMEVQPSLSPGCTGGVGVGLGGPGVGLACDLPWVSGVGPK